MSKSEIITLEINGPEGVGLSKLELEQEDFQSDLPEQSWHIYFEDAALGLTVGVWTTTSMQEAFGPYPGDEFMCILEGHVAIVGKDGRETFIEEGEAFCIQNGVPVSWKQEGFLRKFFITYNRTEGILPEANSDNNDAFVLNQDTLSKTLQQLYTTFPFEINGKAPNQSGAPFFVNDTQNMHVGMWESAPFESMMKAFPCSEFVQLLKGKISITEQSGQVHSFGPGDVFFIPVGTVCSWKITTPVRKLYCMLTHD